MSKQASCKRCGEVFEEPGSVIYGSPDNTEVRIKHNVCRDCYLSFERWLNPVRYIAMKDIEGDCEETLQSVKIAKGTELVMVGFNEYVIEYRIIGTGIVVQLHRMRLSDKIGDYANYFAPVEWLKLVE